MYDVAIIGAGIVGAMIARELSKYELKICILEKENDVSMGATKANSAIVHAGFDAKEGTLKAELNVKGSKMMEEIARDLGVKYCRNGSLVVGFDDDDRKTLEELLKRGEKNGVEGLEIVEKDRLLELEPNVGANAVAALYAPTGAIICPYELTIAAVGNAMDNGAILKRNFEVIKISDLNDRFLIESQEEKIEAVYIVNAAGVFSDHVASLVGDDSFKVHPRRGEYLVLDKECGNIVSHTVFMTPGKMGKGILVTPTVDGNLLIGPTAVDISDKEDKSTTVGFFDSIFGIAEKSVRNIPRNKTITSFSGLRAVGDTGDFIINSPVSRFVNVAGIESPGLSASPAIAEYVVGILKEQGLNLTPNPDYNPKRRSIHAFRDASIEEKNEIIRKDPSYGRIVCRCESVTEGEILEALRREPKARDLDAVKRRTRSGMGRCQGGFCSSYITELLSSELDIPFEKITKFGRNSVINKGKTKEVKNDT